MEEFTETSLKRGLERYGEIITLAEAGSIEMTLLALEIEQLLDRVKLTVEEKIILRLIMEGEDIRVISSKLDTPLSSLYRKYNKIIYKLEEVYR